MAFDGSDPVTLATKVMRCTEAQLFIRAYRETHKDDEPYDETGVAGDLDTYETQKVIPDYVGHYLGCHASAAFIHPAAHNMQIVF